eukprot:322025_1
MGSKPVRERHHAIYGSPTSNLGASSSTKLTLEQQEQAMLILSQPRKIAKQPEHVRTRKDLRRHAGVRSLSAIFPPPRDGEGRENDKESAISVYESIELNSIDSQG